MGANPECVELHLAGVEGTTLLHQHQPDGPQKEKEAQRRSASGSELSSLSPAAPTVPPSPTKLAPIAHTFVRTIKRRTALIFVLYSMVVALLVFSFLVYQHSSLATLSTDHAARVLQLELSIRDLRNSLSYMRSDVREIRYGLLGTNSSSSTPSASSAADELPRKCVPLDYPQYDRAIWNGSDADRERLYSDLELYTENACFRDSPEYLWRLAVSFYYKAALLPATVAATHTGGANRKATLTNQIIILKRANDTIYRARDLTHSTDARVLKWCALINGYAIELKADQKERLAFSFQFKETIDRAIQLDPHDPQSLNGRANWGFLISGITNPQRMLAQQFLGTVPFARLLDAIDDALAADRLYKSGVRLLANGSVAPVGNAGVLEVRSPRASKATLVLLAASYARTSDEDSNSEARLLEVAREAHRLPVTTWEDREADKQLAELLISKDIRFD